MQNRKRTHQESDDEVESSNSPNESSSSEENSNDELYSDIMLMSELSAGKDKLDKFLEKRSNKQPVAFVERLQILDVWLRFNCFMEQAMTGNAKIEDNNFSPTKRLLIDAFNYSSPEMKAHFLADFLGSQMARVGIQMMLLDYPQASNVIDIRSSLVKKLRDIGDVIESKNKESYEAVAKMPAYSTVINARRAEVEQMLNTAAEIQQNQLHI